MQNNSLWEEISPNTANYPDLNEDIHVDVAIIGGGITGITAASQLRKAGKNIAIIEAEKIGSGTTGFSTGNLYVPVQPYFQTIISKFNLETAKAIAHSRQFAIDYIERNATENNIHCNFSRRPWYLYTNQTEKLSFLNKEMTAFKNMDITINETNTLPFPLPLKKAFVIENQARFNPLQYVINLAASISGKDCHIFEKTRVTSIKEKNNSCILETNKGRVFAKDIIIATHTPTGINLTQAFTAAYRSYVVGVQLHDNYYPEGQVWDLDKPHHALCTHAISSDKPDILIVAGNHHKTGQENNTQARYDELETYLRQHFPVTRVSHKWSAQHYHTADGIPYIGLASRFTKHVYLATGYYADGLIYGTLAGIILTDTILKHENPLINLYQANRFDPIKSLPFLMKENTNVLMQYLKDYPFRENIHYKDIKKGEGKVITMEGEKWAISKDDNNQLHIVSAVCTHMKCVINWNNAEKTWDCPCHGSRFTQQGTVIEGPANCDLRPYNKE